MVKRVLVDTGASVDVLFFEAFEQLGVALEMLKPHPGKLITFSGEEVEVAGLITLKVTLGAHPFRRMEEIEFTVVRMPFSYNAILGRVSLYKFQAVTSIYHLKVKFPVGAYIGEVKGKQDESRNCYIASLKSKQHPPVFVLEQEDDPEKRFQPKEDKVVFTPFESEHEKLFLGQHGADNWNELRDLLSRSRSVFAWSARELRGVSPNFMMHSLNIREGARPVVQRKRKMTAEYAEACQAEVQKLLDAGFIREVQYPKWIANPVLVKKSNGKWRMCIDFRDLNSACPKDSYPLPSIDSLVDHTAGYEVMSFLDAFSGYNQVQMDPRDAECTAFITNTGMYCYKVMPFGLKNAGSTFQRLMDRIFKDLIGGPVSVYVDDIVVKSRSREEHVKDLSRVFTALWENRVSLNPEKCVFGVGAGKFLGFLVSQRGIDVNPEKVAAIVGMSPPRTIKDVQCLNGAINYLGRFCSKLADRVLPFFVVLKKKGAFKWTPELQKAFDELKLFLASLPTLSPPERHEELQLYVAAGKETVSAVLTRQAMIPVYFLSRVLKPVEQRYSHAERIALSVITAARRLRPYFQAHTIHVLSEYPLRQILHQPAFSGRMTKWAVELSEFDLEYRPRTAIKAQALADFLVEATFQELSDEGSCPWQIFVDGARSEAGGGAGIILEGPGGFSSQHSLHFEFSATNNEAEYEALIAGLEMAILNGARSCKVFTDSEVIAKQVHGEYEARTANLPQYLIKAKSLIASLDSFAIESIPRASNTRADALAKLGAAMPEELGNNVVLERRRQAAIIGAIMFLDDDDWISPLKEYLANGALPSDARAAKSLKAKAAYYCLRGERLYRRGIAEPDLLCVQKHQAEEILEEMHSGVCGGHPGWRLLVQKITRADNVK